MCGRVKLWPRVLREEVVRTLRRGGRRWCRQHYQKGNSKLETQLLPRATYSQTLIAKFVERQLYSTGVCSLPDMTSDLRFPMFCACMFGAHGVRSLATLNLYWMLSANFKPKRSGIARFPCDSTAFLFKCLKNSGFTSFLPRDARIVQSTVLLH